MLHRCRGLLRLGQPFVHRDQELFEERQLEGVAQLVRLRLLRGTPLCCRVAQHRYHALLSALHEEMHHHILTKGGKSLLLPQDQLC